MFPKNTPSGLSIGNILNTISFLSSCAIPCLLVRNSIIPYTTNDIGNLCTRQYHNNRFKSICIIHTKHFELPWTMKEVAESEGWLLAITMTHLLFVSSFSTLSVMVTSWQSLPCWNQIKCRSRKFWKVWNILNKTRKYKHY